MPYADPAKNAECKRRYQIEHREQANKSSRKSCKANRERRRSVLSQYPCLLCGNPDDSVIQWHHVFPEDKSFGIMGGLQRSMTIWWEEVCKCIPLCANCHVKLHKDELCLIPIVRIE